MGKETDLCSLMKGEGRIKGGTRTVKKAEKDTLFWAPKNRAEPILQIWKRTTIKTGN